MLRQLRHNFSETAGVITMVVACIVLGGWVFKAPILTSAVPGYVTMKFNTALCFLLCGLALYYSSSGSQSKTANACSVLVVAVAVLTLTQHIFNRNLGIDQLLWRDPFTTSSEPGRMSAGTSINFIFIGTAIFLLNNKRYHRTIQILTFLALFISVLAILVFDFANQFANILPLLTTMAVHTALLFILLCLGIFFSSVVRDAGFNLEWRLAGSFIIIISVALLSLYVFSRAIGDTISTRELTRRINDALYTSQQLEFATKDIRGKTKDFLFTGDETHLKSFNRLHQIVDSCIQNLKKHAGDDSIQQSNIDSLDISAGRAVTFCRGLIDLRRSNDLLTVVNSGQLPAAEKLFNQAFRINAKIQDREKVTLKEIEDTNQSGAVKTSKAIGFFQVLIILVLIVAFGIVQNNTRIRNKAEAELSDSREWFSTTLSSIGDAVIATNNHSVITFMNPVAQELTGWEEKDAKGQSLDLVFDIVNEQTRNVVESPVTKALQLGKVVGLANHTLLRRKDKTEVAIDDSAAPIMDRHGSIQGVVLVFRDVTEQKKNENALKESEEKFQKAFQASAAGITITRLSDSKYMEVNDAFVRMTGYTREELMGHSSTELGLVVSLERREEMLKQIRENGSAKHFEMTVRNKAGSILEVLASVETILVKEEKLAINIIYDITDRKRAEDQLEAANKDLEAFSYSVSHDLRAPLRSIIGYTKIIEEDFADKMNDEGKRTLTIVQKNAAKMNQLINELLEFSKLGRKELKKSDIRTAELVQTVVDSVRHSFPCHANIEIKHLLSVCADPTLLAQVWTNLITNALKYSAKVTNPKIEIGSDKVEGSIVFYVKDNGAGFDMKYVDRLFGVFQRLHGSNEFEGTGVGLSIVKRIVEKHGGHVWADGKVNEGATFYFSLPNGEKNKN